MVMLLTDRRYSVLSLVLLLVAVITITIAYLHISGFSNVKVGINDVSIPTSADTVIVPEMTSTVDWNERFSFVPNNVHDCFTLFNGSHDVLSPHIIQKIKEHDEHIEEAGIEKPYGYTYQFSKVAVKTYLEIAAHPSVKTICETGFNGGHSTVGWLESNQNAQVYSFEIGYFPYTKPIAELVLKKYPDRLHMIWGDSNVEMKKFREANPDVKCDVMMIDGDHSTFAVKNDLLNFREMASENGVVIIDNYPMLGPHPKFMKILGDAWDWGKKNRIIAEVFNCMTGETKDFGFSVARFS